MSDTFYQCGPFQHVFVVEMGAQQMWAAAAGKTVCACGQETGVREWGFLCSCCRAPSGDSPRCPTCSLVEVEA